MGNLRTGINKCNGFVIDGVHQHLRSMRDDQLNTAGKSLLLSWFEFYLTNKETNCY